MFCLKYNATNMLLNIALDGFLLDPRKTRAPIKKNLAIAVAIGRLLMKFQKKQNEPGCQSQA
jgi:hypothetical protein